jgi:Acetyltransferase (GNAT) domain
MQPNPSLLIWNADESKDYRDWLSLWQSWSNREIFAHPNYVKLYADGEKTRALCAAWFSNNIFILYPFIWRDLTNEPFWSRDLGSVCDIITPYGYGGAYIWGNDNNSDTVVQFWQDFNVWATEQNVVSEFIRFSLFDDTVSQYPGIREERAKNVVRSLDLDEESLWMDFKHKVRKNVKKARKLGVSVEIDDTGAKINSFLQLYADTMQRRDASEQYYFPRNYFEQIHQTLSGQFIYFHAVYDSKIIATELVLVSADRVYSFLGGTDSHSFDLRPNDLLKYEILLWAKQQGKRHFVLGGGYQANDGIYNYKLTFAPEGIFPFYVGRRILAKDIYDRLVCNKIEQLSPSKRELIDRSEYFPKYRA